MSSVLVKPVATGREKKQFLELPWTIYRDVPQWVPPLRMNQKEMVNFSRCPFYDVASIQTFLAYRDGVPCGRIAAIDNPEHNRRYPEDQRGFLGFFESIDDQQVAHQLFDAARHWLEGRGHRMLRGPINPSLNYEVGLLIEGFDLPPTFMMTYNRPYYQRLWEEYGFTKAQDLYAFAGNVTKLESPDPKYRLIYDECLRRFQPKMRTLDRSRFMDDVRMFLDIYNRSLVSTWGFVPLSPAEVDHLAKALRYLIIPEMTCVVEIEGRPVAAVFGLLDYNPIIKQIDGRLFPFGFLKLFFKRRHIRRVRLMSTNILPEYQHWGLGLVATSQLIPKGLEMGLEEAEFSWVLESNHLSRKTLERAGIDREKTYRVFDYLPNSIG
ncbi:MAG: N-acetyltransferase [Pirellulaceae bacterium]|nr:hypothetical protein [Planctomycetales bacterium]